MEQDKRIIEVNGVKIEVDLRSATRVDTFKVGDKVKLLIKSYGDTFDSCAGVIVGFDNFKERPTIIVAYLKNDYSPELKFAYINKDSKDFEMVQANENDIPFTKEQVLTKMDSLIETKKREMEDSIFKKETFLKMFGQYFESN